MPQLESRRYLSVQDAAELLGCSVAAIRKWIRLGKIRVLHASRLVRIRQEDLEAFLRGEDR